MAAVIIKKRKLEKFARKVLKEVFLLLHFEEEEYKNLIKEREKLDHRLFLSIAKCENYKHYFDEEKEGREKIEEEINSIVKRMVVNEVFNLDDIYQFLVDINIEEGIEDDTMYDLEAFLELYRVFTYIHEHLV